MQPSYCIWCVQSVGWNKIGDFHLTVSRCGVHSVTTLFRSLVNPSVAMEESDNVSVKSALSTHSLQSAQSLRSSKSRKDTDRTLGHLSVKSGVKSVHGENNTHTTSSASINSGSQASVGSTPYRRQKLVIQS